LPESRYRKCMAGHWARYHCNPINVRACLLNRRYALRFDYRKISSILARVLHPN